MVRNVKLIRNFIFMIRADLDLGLLLHLEDRYGSSSHCDLSGSGANRL